MIARIHKWVLDLLRPFFVDDIDPNEDFVCGVCGKPVLRRVLTCSKRCGDLLP